MIGTIKRWLFLWINPKNDELLYKVQGQINYKYLSIAVKELIIIKGDFRIRRKI